MSKYEGKSVEERFQIAIEESSKSKQVGGSHYTSLPIQPVEYIMKNRLDFLQGTIIKYVTRFRDKGGVEDLMKARHCIDMLIEFEEDNERTSSV